MEIITSSNNKFIKFLLSLDNKKTILKEEQFLIEGNHLIEEAIKAKVLLKIITSDLTYTNFNEIVYVSEQVYQKISINKTPQKLLGVCKLPFFNFEQIKICQTILLLDKINNPGNLGSLIRTSYIFGLDAIILAKESVFPFLPKVVQSSQGAIFNIKIHFDIDLKNLDFNYFNLYTTFLNENYKIVNSYKPVKPWILALGSEHHGLDKSLKEYQKENILIEMKNGFDSLNISIAGSIILYFFLNN